MRAILSVRLPSSVKEVWTTLAFGSASIALDAVVIFVKFRVVLVAQTVYLPVYLEICRRTVGNDVKYCMSAAASSPDYS